jgi:hypothetical protein
MFGVDFWSNLQKNLNSTNKENKHFRQAPLLFVKEALFDEKSEIFDFLSNPWVLIQCPWHPVVFHQWLVAALAETIEFDTVFSTLRHLPVPKNLHPIVLRLASIKNKAMILIRCGFKLLSLQIKSKNTVDFDIVKCILDKVVLPFRPIIRFLEDGSAHAIIVNLEKMLWSGKEAFRGEFIPNCKVTSCQSGTIYDFGAEFTSFEDIFGNTEGGLKEVIKELDSGKVDSADATRMDKKTRLALLDECERNWDEWEKRHLQPYCPFQVEEEFKVSWESVRSIIDESCLLNFISMVKKSAFPNTYCKDENYGVSQYLKYLQLINLKAVKDAIAVEIVYRVMQAQNIEFISAYQPEEEDEEVPELTVEEIHELLNEVETCEAPRDCLKSDLKALIGVLPQGDGAEARKHWTQDIQVIMINSNEYNLHKGCFK